MSSLESRIEALEKTNRRWRNAACGLGALALFGAIGAANVPDTVPDVVQAKRIEVLAPNGEPAIVLRANAHGSELALSAQGANHERMVGLAADKDGARLLLMKHKEAPLFFANVDDDGSWLTLTDGREPSQRPRSIVFRTARPSKNWLGGAIIMLSRGQRKDDVEACLTLQESGDKTALTLSGSHVNNAAWLGDPQNGKPAVTTDSDPDREG